ncbi:MAG: hypothetical protein ACJ796_13625 [Gemmatimonadaceae bacterium]
MRRNFLHLLVGAVVALAVACRDSAVAPARSATSLSASAAPSLSSSVSNPNRTLLGTIELSPNGGTYHVGDFDVIMPASAVCEPAVTKYGKKHWDDDCIAARRTITVNVIAKKQGNRVSVDFQPDLRFRPSAGWVLIQTNAYRELLTSQNVRQLSTSSSFFNNFAIYYVPTGGKSQIDELQSTGDGSLVTHVDLRSGLVWRRVKHFSGFLVSLGDKCDPTTGNNSCPIDDGLGGVGSSSISAFSLATPFSLSSVIVTPNDSSSAPH